MATFGDTDSSGTSQENIAIDYKIVSKFTLSEAADVSKLSLYLSANNTGCLVRGVIYSDSSGSPDARKAVGSEIAVPNAPAAWYDSTLTCTLAAGDYWLGFISGGTPGSLYYGQKTVSNNRKYRAETYSASPADPFGSVDATDSKQITCYATYSVAANPTYTVLNGSDEQLSNVNAGGTDIDAASYKDAVELSDSELATLLSSSFGKKNVAVLPDLTGVADARQIKKTTFSAETESA